MAARPDAAGWNAPALGRLLLVGIGASLVPLDSALNIAFPAITARFELALPQIQWLIICYVLTYGSLMLGVGRLGDIFGHALVFRIGLAWSSLAFLLCSLAPDYGWLLFFRVLQGLGAALAISCTPALATALFPESLRPRVLGLYGLILAAGSVVGPALGGWLVSHFGWQAVFWFRIPVALLPLLLLRGLPGPPPAATRGSFDLPGAALLALAMGALLLAVNQARHLADGGLAALGLAGLGLLAGWGFTRRSRVAPRPILPPGAFRDPRFNALNLAMVLAQMAGFAVMLLLPYLLARDPTLPLALAGLLLASSAGATMAASFAGGWLLGRVAGRVLVGLGILCIGTGLGLIALSAGATPLPLLLAALALHGTGLGLIQVSHAEIVTGTLAREDRGVAGSLTLLTRTLGVVGAASLLTLVFETRQAAALAAGAAAEAAFLAGFSGAFALAALLCVLALGLLALPFRRNL